MGDQELEARVARLSCWRGTVTPEALGGGLSNKNFTVADGGETFVVRLGVDVPEHNLLRRTEIQCSRAAAEAGFSPALVHVEPGALVFRFVEGRTLGPADLRQDAMLARVVALLRDVHDTMPRFVAGPPPLFWVFHAIRDYARGLVAGGSRRAGDMARLADVAADLERAVGPVDLRFGHNDLLAANLIDDGRRLWLIDWEYGGYNSPLFDLGNLASNNELSPAQAEWVLAAYDGKAPDEARRRAYRAMTAASLLREAMWSLTQELHAKLPVDYAAYSDDYLGRFARAIDDIHGGRAA